MQPMWRISVRNLRVVACLSGAALGLVVIVTALIPGGHHLPEGIEFIPFVIAFPLFGWAIVERRMGASRNAKPTWPQLGAELSKYRNQLAVVIPLLIVLWAIAIFSIVSLRGQPVHAGDRYYLDDHGSLIPVSQTGYEEATAKQQRIFAAGGTAVLIIAGGLTLTFDPTRRSTNPKTSGAESS
jgi:hypothetical protein